MRLRPFWGSWVGKNDSISAQNKGACIGVRVQGSAFRL